MGHGGEGSGGSEKIVQLKSYSWEEIKKHTVRGDQWLVINRNVYNISQWSSKHPGGARILSHYAGEDATDVWTALHNNKDYVRKFLKPLLIGKLTDDYQEPEIVRDMRELRATAEQMGLFKVNVWFYVLHMAHFLALEVLAYWVLSTYGCGWLPYLTAALIQCVLQSQAGWSQHDYGHLSVFNSRKLNHLVHHFIIGTIKGASSHWWNFRHFQHHAKPNVIRKDPDIDIPYLFLLGRRTPVEWGKKRRGFMPYNFQQDYFFLIGPPLLLPLYFQYEIIYFLVKRRDWTDIVAVFSFFFKHFYLYTPLMGAWNALWYFVFIRFLESHWFTWVTQMNHIPMDVDHDSEHDWLTIQLKSTCNVESGWFNDWFTGHLNFQIEHHLFPTMPRHNYIKIQPLVKSLCEKHGLDYQCKTLYRAFADIVTPIIATRIECVYCFVLALVYHLISHRD